MLIVFLIIPIVSFFFGYYFGKTSRPKQNEIKTAKIPPTPKSNNPEVKEGHMPPRYYGYKKGSFANINQCSKCRITGLYEDLHTTNPCPHCGHSVRRWGAAKWAEVDGQMQWVEPKG